LALSADTKYMNRTLTPQQVDRLATTGSCPIKVTDEDHAAALSSQAAFCAAALAAATPEMRAAIKSAAWFVL
jgi:hypothetical protein